MYMKRRGLHATREILAFAHPFGIPVTDATNIVFFDFFLRMRISVRNKSSC